MRGRVRGRRSMGLADCKQLATHFGGGKSG